MKRVTIKWDKYYHRIQKLCILDQNHMKRYFWLKISFQLIKDIFMLSSWKFLILLTILILNSCRIFVSAIQRSRDIKELQNDILCIIRVWSLFFAGQV